MNCEAEKELRFNVGDSVKCRAAGCWQEAKVLKQWDNGNPYRREIQNEKKDERLGTNGCGYFRQKTVDLIVV